MLHFRTIYLQAPILRIKCLMFQAAILFWMSECYVTVRTSHSHSLSPRISSMAWSTPKVSPRTPHVWRNTFSKRQVDVIPWTFHHARPGTLWGGQSRAVSSVWCQGACHLTPSPVNCHLTVIWLLFRVWSSTHCRSDPATPCQLTSWTGWSTSTPWWCSLTGSWSPTKAGGTMWGVATRPRRNSCRMISTWGMSWHIIYPSFPLLINYQRRKCCEANPAWNESWLKLTLYTGSNSSGTLLLVVFNSEFSHILRIELAWLLCNVFKTVYLTLGSSGQRRPKIGLESGICRLRYQAHSLLGFI